MCKINTFAKHVLSHFDFAALVVVANFHEAVFNITHQAATIDIDIKNEVIKGITEIFLEPNNNSLRLISLHCERPVVHRVEINGVACKYTQYFEQSKEEVERRVMEYYNNNDPGELNIYVPEGILPADEANEENNTDTNTSKITLKIKIWFTLRNPTSGVIFVQDKSKKASKYLYTKSQIAPGHVRKWLPCLDSLYVRCTWDIRYIVPASSCYSETTVTNGLHNYIPNVAIASGELIAQVTHPVDPSKRLYRYMHSAPSPACSLAFAIGPFESCLRVDKAFLEESSKSVALFKEFESEEGNGESNNNTGNKSLDANSEEKTTDGACGDSTEQRDNASDAGALENGDDKEETESNANESQTEPKSPEDKLASNKEQETQISAIKAVGGILAFGPGSCENELLATCKFISELFAFHSQEFYSYPFTTYKIVFMDNLSEPIISGAAITIVSTDYLHPDDVIEPVYETRRCLSTAISQQWFGIYIIPETMSDQWLVQYTTLSEKEKEFLYLKAPIVLYMLNKRMMKGGISLGLRRVIPKIMMTAMAGDLGASNSIGTGWFLKLCRKVSGVNLKSFAEHWIYGSGCPIFRFSYAFNRKKLVVEIKMSQESTNARATASWAKPQIFTGQMIARVREADGTPYEHVLDIKDSQKKFEVQFNTKYKRIRRSTKRFHMRQMAAAAEELTVNTEVLGLEDDDETYSNIALFGTESEEMKRNWGIVEWGEADEESLASGTVEWIRMDSDLDWACLIYFEQADFMWAAQLQKDRDVTAQLEAVKSLENSPSLAASTTLMRTIMDARVFYRVRVDAALALVKHAIPELNWIGLRHLIKIYQYRYCLPPDGNEEKENDITAPRLPKSNNFVNIGEYFTQKAILAALSNINQELSDAPGAAKSLILNTLKYNDNSENVFSDTEYVAALMNALVNRSLDPNPASSCENPEDSSYMQSMLGELERLRKLDALIPTYQNTITVTYLKSIIKASLVYPELGIFDPKLFLSMSLETNYRHVREAALEGLIFYWGLQSYPAVSYYFSIATNSTDPLIAETAAHFALLCIAILVYNHEANNTDDDLIIEEVGIQRPDSKTLNVKLAAAFMYVAESLPDGPNIQLALYSCLRDTVCNKSTLQQLKDIIQIVYTPPKDHRESAGEHTSKKLKIKLKQPKKPEDDPEYLERVTALACDGIVPAPMELPPINDHSTATSSPSDRPLSATIKPLKPLKIKIKSGLSRGDSVPRSPSSLPRDPRPSSPMVHSAISNGIGAAKQDHHRRTPSFQHTASPLHLSVAHQSPYRDSSPLPTQVFDTPGPQPIQHRSRRSSHATVVSDLDVTSPQHGYVSKMDAKTKKKLRKLIRTLMNNPNGYPFSRPVDPVLDGCPTYYDIIKNPMDLATIKQKLERNEYVSPEDFEHDMRLMFENCFAFNPPNTLVHTMGQELENEFELEWTSPEMGFKLEDVNQTIIEEPQPPAISPVIPQSDPSEQQAHAKTEIPETITVEKKPSKQKRRKSRRVSTNAPVDSVLETRQTQPQNQLPDHELLAPLPQDNISLTTPKPSEEMPQKSPITKIRIPRIRLKASKPPSVASSTTEQQHGPAATKQDASEPQKHLDNTDSQSTKSAPSTELPHQALTQSSNSPQRRSLELVKCQRILRKVQTHPSALEFLHPVDPIRQGVPTYLDIIKHPMDLGTMDEKLASGQYSTAEDFRKDFELVISNCKLFNPEGTLVHQLGVTLHTVFEKAWKREFGSASASHGQNTPQYSKSDNASAPSKVTPIVTVPGAEDPTESLEASSELPINPKIHKKVVTLINKLLRNSHASPFLEPVDPVALGIPTYFDIVKHPMDLGTIKKKVSSHEYSTVADFVSDIRLMLDNCYLFNPPDTWVHSYGKKIESAFNDLLRKEKWVQFVD
ncbi:hypothetical protein H4219_000679 [Mycoemilia scoparia]|uniref:Transcription initiation factor TFIID subunit 2 n=1 Tax=Mycoemilia scoparia TaxID=417184 RepID=A0A9W8DWB7_9FUNG|nr:hypothetical protein H4219_000679 [Mycoemilia scoparia]